MAEKDNKLQLVTFLLGEELYGIDIMEVEGIVQENNVRAIPNAPVYVEGIFNLRGKIIPVISLHKRFHLKRAELNEQDKLLSGLVTININNMLIGIVIDKISKVISVEIEKIQPPPQMLSGIGAEYIRGVTQESEGYLIILNVGRLFDPKELQQLGQIAT